MTAADVPMLIGLGRARGVAKIILFMSSLLIVLFRKALPKKF